MPLMGRTSLAGSTSRQRSILTLATSPSLFEPDVINNIGIESPYSVEEHNKRHLGIINGSTNNTLGQVYEKGVDYHDVLNSREEKQNPPCIIDPPKDGTRIKICINHLAPNLSVCNTSIVDISQMDD
jgi:hypothetical protein